MNDNLDNLVSDINDSLERDAAAKFSGIQTVELLEELIEDNRQSGFWTKISVVASVIAAIASMGALLLSVIAFIK